MVSGLSVPDDVDGVDLGGGRIFRNPAAPQDSAAFPTLGANTAVYAGEGKRRRLVGEVATYLIALGSQEGPYGGTILEGSGSVETGSGGLAVNSGDEASSSAAVRVSLEHGWSASLLMQQEFDKAILPLRLLTKGRILAFPHGVFAGQRRSAVFASGVDNSCPEVVGTGYSVELTPQDCNAIERFSRRLSATKLDEFEVPVSLFSGLFYKVAPDQRALDVIMMLESLLSQSSESIRYKIAFRAACLTTEGADRLQAFELAKQAYTDRNNVIHGNKKTLDKSRARLRCEVEEIEALARNCLTLACLKPESTEGGRRVSVLKRQEGAPVLLG